MALQQRLRRHLSAAAWLTALGAGGCATWQDHVAAGRLGDACFAASGDDESRAAFHAALLAQLQASAELVPHDAVALALGGPALGYGQDLGLYDVSVRVPGAEVQLDTPLYPDAAPLLTRLPPLVAPRSAMRVPGPVRGDLGAIEAWGDSESGGASGRAGSGFGDAVGAAAQGFGEAIGVAASVPIRLIVGLFDGLLSPLFGSGSGSSSGSGTPSPELFPVQWIDLPVPSEDDAVLEDEAWRAATAAADAEVRALQQQVDDELARRRALAETGLRASLCPLPAPGCRLLRAPGAWHTNARLTFLRNGLFGLDACEVTVPIEVPLPSALPPPIPAQRLPLTVRRLDALAPPWARSVAAPSVDLRADTALAHTVADLACSVETTKAARDRDRSAPDLLVRLALGERAVRSTTFFLGNDVARAAFVVPHVDLTQGERLRVSLRSTADEGRSLGAALRPFDGHLPVVLRSRAFVVSCGAPDPARLDAARAAALADLTAGQAEPLPIDDAARAEGDLERRRATVAAAQLHGWDHDVVRAAVAALAPPNP